VVLTYTSTAETTAERYLQRFVELVNLYLSSKILVISKVLRVQKTAQTLIMLDCWANCAEHSGLVLNLGNYT